MNEPAAGGRNGQTGNEVAASSDAMAAPSSSCLSGGGLLDLPHDCLVRIMSGLSAPDVCRMARVCRRLRRVADCDGVWTSRLPADLAINPAALSRKDLYFRLRAGMVHKDLSQPFWLDPETGEGLFVKPARDLKVTWGDDLYHWDWQRQADSWFAESACLLDVCWLEITGEFEAMFVPGSYTVSFRLNFPELYGGWSRAPVKLSLSTSNGDHIESQRYLSGSRNSEIANPATLRSLPSSWWKELDIGEFVVPREMHVKLDFFMMEIEEGHEKDGLVVDCVKIQPTCAISRDV